MWKKMTVILVITSISVSAGYCMEYGTALRTAQNAALAGNLAQARSTCSTVVAQCPGVPIEPQALLLLGKILYKSGDPTNDVMSVFAELVERFPKSPEASEALLRIGYLNERLKRPTLEWDRVIVDYPYSKEAPEASLRIAYRQERLGHDASAAFNRIIQDYPESKESVEALKCLGQLALRNLDADMAISYFSRSANMSDIDEEEAEVSQVELGYAYISKYWANQDTKSLNQAISAFSTLLKSRSQDRLVRARLGRGEAFLILGLPNRALVEYEAVLALNIKNTYLKGVTQFEIGVCYNGQELWSKAEIAFAVFLSSIPGKNLLAKDNYWKQIRPDFMKMMDRAPQKAQMLTGIDLVARSAQRRAYALARLQRIDEARSLVNDISSAFPDIGEKLRAEIAQVEGVSK